MQKKIENIRKRKSGNRTTRHKKMHRQINGCLVASVRKTNYNENGYKSKATPSETNSNTPRIILSEMNFITLLQMWQETNEIRLKGATKARYENLINSQIIPCLGELTLSEITVSTINCFLNAKLANGRRDGCGGLSPSYVRSISFIITSALNYAVAEGFLPPLKRSINKPSIVKTEPSILSFEDQKELELRIKSKPSPTNIGILTSLYTGLRIGEICALRWDDIDLNARTIHVRHTVSRVKAGSGDHKTELILDEPKTTASKRVIPIPSPLFSALFDCRKTATSEYLVSTRESFVSPRTYDARFHRLLHECHIEDLNYHSLRHTFATRCIEAGVDVKSLSEILGHANVSITLNTYVHSSIEMKKKQLEKLSLLTI